MLMLKLIVIIVILRRHIPVLIADEGLFSIEKTNMNPSPPQDLSPDQRVEGSEDEFINIQSTMHYYMLIATKWKGGIELDLKLSDNPRLAVLRLPITPVEHAALTPDQLVPFASQTYLELLVDDGARQQGGNEDIVDVVHNHRPWRGFIL